MDFKTKIGIFEYTYKLNKILKEKDISIYQLEKDTGLDHKTIKKYCFGKLKRLDLKVVSILCEYLKCNFNDIIEIKLVK